MFAIATKKGGMCFAMPDVCNTPAAPSPVPVPYPNTAQLNLANPATTRVLVECKEGVVEDSKISMSSGDEAGSVGGVVSGTFAQQVSFRSYSAKVYFEGKKVVMHTATTAHNGSSANAPAGCHVAPSQAKVFTAM